MAYKVLREFTSTGHGNLSMGDVIDVPEGLAIQWLAAGMIEPMGNRQGEKAPSSASQADQASPDGSANTYETKPLRRSPRTPALKPSTAASATDATKTGGDATTKKSKKKASSAGRKASTRRASTD